MSWMFCGKMVWWVSRLDVGNICYWDRADKTAKQSIWIINIFATYNVYISMYLGSNPEPIDEQKRIASMLKRENRTMNIKFFDAASKNCWCNF